MKITLTMGADLLRGMACLACKDYARPGITGVCLHIEKDRTRLIATNGRIIGFYLCREFDVNYTTTAKLPVKITIPIPNFTKLGCGSAKLQIEQEDVDKFRRVTTFTFGEWKQAIETSSNDFPPTDQIVPPKMEPVTGIDLNLDLLHLFTDCLKKMGFTNPGYFHLRNGGNGQLMHAFPGETATRDRFYGVIAPLRNFEEYTIPKWATTQQEPPQTPPDAPQGVETPAAPSNTPTEATPTQETAPQQNTAEPQPTV